LAGLRRGEGADLEFELEAGEAAVGWGVHLVSVNVLAVVEGAVEMRWR
jgi:hypothetical protein